MVGFNIFLDGNELLMDVSVSNLAIFVHFGYYLFSSGLLWVFSRW